MVACHSSDLAAAASHGLHTAHIARPNEHGPGKGERAPSVPVDFAAADLRLWPICSASRLSRQAVKPAPDMREQPFRSDPEARNANRLPGRDIDILVARHEAAREIDRPMGDEIADHAGAQASATHDRRDRLRPRRPDEKRNSGNRRYARRDPATLSEIHAWSDSTSSSR